MLKSLILTLSLILHPVHVTITSIEHIPATDSIKVFVRMYYDDFLLDYCMFNEDADPDELSLTELLPDDHMNQYLAERVVLTVNNKRLYGRIINQTLAIGVDEVEVSINLVYHTERQPEIFSIRNEIMTGLYEDQANMTIVRMSGLEEGLKLTPGKSEQTFILK
ncbi:MAG TPA: hypothetical protein PLZ75_13255 [Bacteroidales bacterium]|jgi:hypothetical protein|nr:hypothetical protein [Bacteroidales bacterium]HQH25346.1 hypothetical protein [Bacteroidales bacterium]HQJ82854.1 hypothetical protein [Bacteroidales bacterium]